MAKNLTPAQAAEKFVRRASAAVPDMIAGVKAVTENPMTKAIAKKDKLRANWTASLDNGKWERGMRRVDLPAWQSAMIDKGSGRVSAGLQQSQAKMEAFFAELLPYQADAQKAIASMPDLTLEDSIQRQVAWTRKMAAFKRRGVA